MPRYHFNVHDGHNIPDVEGVELPSIDAARKQAVELSGALLRDHAEMFWRGEEWKMEVTDSSGLILFTLIFLALDAATTSKQDLG